jgi:hypothetical protein
MLRKQNICIRAGFGDIPGVPQQPCTLMLFFISIMRKITKTQNELYRISSNIWKLNSLLQNFFHDISPGDIHAKLFEPEDLEQLGFHSADLAQNIGFFRDFLEGLQDPQEEVK